MTNTNSRRETIARLMALRSISHTIENCTPEILINIIEFSILFECIDEVIASIVINTLKENADKDCRTALNAAFEAASKQL